MNDRASVMVKAPEVPTMAGALARLEAIVQRFETLAARGTHGDLPGNGQDGEESPANLHL